MYLVKRDYKLSLRLSERKPMHFTRQTSNAYQTRRLNGLKQAPRAWNEKFTNFLPSLAFQFSHSDPSLFFKHTATSVVILLLYVDDIVLTGSDATEINVVVKELSLVFDMKDLGPLSYFLGINIQYLPSGIFLSQEKYAKDLISTALENPTLYRSIVGALQYLTFTRPDISYSVNIVCQFMAAPTDVHFAAVKRILKYLQYTLFKGLFYKFAKSVTYVTAYCDADWAGDINQRRSTTGFVVYLGHYPISKLPA
ncbi:hypothetical protein ACLB2K_025751 [Fragaria x ananassa]